MNFDFTGFGHDFGDNGIGKLFGNTGQDSYGDSGRLYEAGERWARKAATLAVAGSLAYLAAKLGVS